MRSNLRILSMLTLFFVGQYAFAQIKGKVLESDGTPSVEAKVSVQGKQVSTRTDDAGNFELKQAKAGDMLVITNIMGEEKTIVANNNMIVKFTTKDIDEVVVLGYNVTTTKKKDVTANTVISSAALENRPNVSFLNSIQGAAPGVSISSGSGSPGSSQIDITIRGLSSLNASTEPLYVIDGIASNSTQFRNLNTNDIDNLSILRDAAATSIYGNRGANGVVIINTKRGKFNTPTSISFTMTTGVNVLPSNKYHMASAKELLTLQRNAGTGFGSTLTPAEIENWKINTNWLDQFFNVATTNQYDLAVTSGGEKVSSYTSLGYMEQNGMVPLTDFKRFSVRNNINGKTDDNRFTYSSQIGLGYSKRNQARQEDSSINNNGIQNVLLGSITGMPYLAPNQFPTGQDLFNAIGTSFNSGEGIYVLEDNLKAGHIPNKYDEVSVLANVSGTYKLTKDLSVTNKSGIDYKTVDRLVGRAPWSYLAIAVREGDEYKYGGYETQSNTREINFNTVTSVNYSKVFGNHSVDAGVYLEYTKAHYRSKSITRNGLDPKTYSPGQSGYIAFDPDSPYAYLPDGSSSTANAGTLSYFATLDYDYKSKYGLSAVVRRDASYRFTPENRWGTFWSVGGRWNIDQEDFMKGSTFSMLKLRASYGTQGNQNVVAVAYGANPLFAASQIIRDIYTTGQGYNDENGTVFSSRKNIDLRWEKISQFNVGVDFRLLSNRLEGNLDYYVKTTDDMYNGVSVSAVNEMFSYSGNNGKMENKGIEALLRYHLFKDGEFKLSVFGNVAYNKNKIKEMQVEQKTGDLLNVVGGTAYQWNLIPYLGVNQSNGNLLFLDKDGNPTETPVDADRRKTGKSYLPKYDGGFGLNSQYKGFFLDVLFSFQAEVWKNDNFLSWAYDPTSMTSQNVSADMLNAWTPDNHTNFPSLNATNTSLDSSSDRFLRNASFVKLKTVTFGYSLPKSILGGNFVKNLRIFAQGENLVTWTKWRGYDPEKSTTFVLGNYPNPRIYSIGANIEF